MFLMNKKGIAVDIGSSTVKVVELQKKGEKIQLTKYAVEAIPQVDIKDENLTIKAKSEAVRRALSSAGITGNKCITSVSGEKILVRYIQLPKMPAEDLENAIKWEAEEYIPFKVEDVNIDFEILGDTPGSSEPKMDVLLVCAKKELIDERMSIVQRAGLIPEIIDVDGFALVNCMEYCCAPQSNSAIAVINIGASKTNINIYFNKNVYFSRDIAIGGNNITNAIVTTKGVSFEEAEKLKTGIDLAEQQNASAGTNDANESEILKSIKGTVEEITGERIDGGGIKDDAAQIVSNSLNSLFTEIKRSIQFFENQMRDARVSELYISGGSVNFKNFDKYMQQEVGIKTIVLNPFTNVAVSPQLESEIRKNNLIPVLGVAMGLGLRKVVI